MDPRARLSPEPSGHTAEPERVRKALALVKREGVGLEIGPSHSPIAPKRHGFNVQVVDHLDAAGLREKYSGHGVALDLIEEVDFIWRGKPLVEVIGQTGCYDWILASHVIEHLPDPITFLRSAEALLAPGGVLSLVIPDKRWCFDHLRPVSTTGELLDAYRQQRTRPSPGNVFDHVASAVRRGEDITWSEGNPHPLTAVHDLNEARERWARADTTKEYDDVHIWRFVPASFHLLVSDLRALGLTQLAINAAFDTDGFEFFFTLAVDPAPQPPVDRLALLAEIGGAQPDGTPPGAEAPSAAHTPVASLAGTALSEPEGQPMLVSERERRVLLAKRRVLEALCGRSASRRRP